MLENGKDIDLSGAQFIDELSHRAVNRGTHLENASQFIQNISVLVLLGGIKGVCLGDSAQAKAK